MSFAKDHNLEDYDDDPYSGFRPLSPIQSELTLNSNENRHQKNHSQTQQNMSSLLNKFIQKDKETEHLRKENIELKDRLKEFEYLIIKGSEEVKRKQQEISSLNTVIDNMKLTLPSTASVENLKRQLEEHQLEIHRLNSEGSQTQTKLRVEVQKEKDMNMDLSRQVMSMKERLDGILKESKMNIDDIQSNFSMTSSKYTQLEKEYLEIKNTVKELTHDNSIKNETLEQAHVVISKLKSELEKLAESGDVAQGKVKEYKGKCKVLKKSNEHYKQIIKDLEDNVGEVDSVRRELSQAREDYEAIMRARLDERLGQEQRRNMKIDDVPVEKFIADLKEKLERIEKENAEKTAEIMTLKDSCELRTKEAATLKETLSKQDEQSKQEFQAFKAQTLRSYHALVQKLQEGANPPEIKNGSPFKALMQAQKIGSDTLNVSGAMSTRLQKGNEEALTSRNSAGFVRTTPIKIYSAKGQSFIESRGHNHNELSSTEHNVRGNSNNVSPFKENEDVQLEKRVEGFDTIQDIQGDGSEGPEIEREQSPDEIIQNIIGPQFFKDEIQRSLDREQYFTLIIESLYIQAEFEVKRFLDKVKQQPAVNAELEAWRMRSEELEQRYYDTLSKYSDASSLTLELTQNNKVLMERLESVSREYNHLSKSHKQQSEVLKANQAHYQKANQSLIRDVQILLQLFHETKVLSNSGRMVDLRSLSKAANECEDFRKGMKSLETFIENINVFEPVQSSNPDPRRSRSSSAIKTSDRKGSHLEVESRTDAENRLDLSVFKLKKKLEQYEARIKQLQDEKEDLKEKMNGLKSEVKGWQETAHVMETDYQKTLKEKERAIKRAQDELDGTVSILKETEHGFRRTETMLAEKELMIARQSETMNDWTDRDADINALIHDKEELIRTLHHEKEDLCEKLDELNEYCTELKRQMGEKHREGGDHRLRKLEKELHTKDEELYIRGKEIEERMEQIFDLEKIISLRDKEISSIRNENLELREQVYDLKGESSRHERSRSRHHGGTLVYDDTASRTQVQRVPRHEKKERRERREASSSKDREGRASSTTMKKQGYGQRNSVGSRRVEKTEESEQEVAVRQLREENTQLAQENKTIFRKLNELNDLINHNKILEREVGGLKKENENEEEILNRSTVRREPLSGNRSKKRTKEDDFDVSGIDEHLEGDDDERQENREPNENNATSENAQFQEKYKAKTKKVFQKRVKELEMLLRYVDHKVKGYNFDRSSYVLSSSTKEGLSLEERKTLAKLGYLVETMLEKNTNLKEFVEDMVKRVENLHVRNYNLTVVIGKIFKSIYKDTVDRDDSGSISPSNMFYEVERLSSSHIPEIVSQFEQIEMMSMTRANSSTDFFEVFALVEPRLNNISELLIKSLKNSGSGKAHSLCFTTKAEDYLNSKVMKMKEVENLQAKLADIIEKDKIQETSLPEHIKGYLQTYSNIYVAVINEFQSVVDFASNLIQGNNNITQESNNVQNLSNYGSDQHVNKVSSLYIPERISYSQYNNPFSAMQKEFDNSAVYPNSRMSAVSLVNRNSDARDVSIEQTKFENRRGSNPFTPTKMGDYSEIVEERVSHAMSNSNNNWGKVSIGDFENDEVNEKSGIHSSRMN